mmetsp:Transcript_11076/g.26262  ORF Transcript_11076/g.26262 Transcript_11076/m.26262 type:complete len:667 (-) Transcript_11076:161-2161(-)
MDLKTCQATEGATGKHQGAKSSVEEDVPNVQAVLFKNLEQGFLEYGSGTGQATVLALGSALYELAKQDESQGDLVRAERRLQRAISWLDRLPALEAEHQQKLRLLEAKLRLQRSRVRLRKAESTYQGDASSAMLGATADLRRLCSEVSLLESDERRRQPWMGPLLADAEQQLMLSMWRTSRWLLKEGRTDYAEPLVLEGLSIAERRGLRPAPSSGGWSFEDLDAICLAAEAKGFEAQSPVRAEAPANDPQEMCSDSRDGGGECGNEGRTCLPGAEAVAHCGGADQSTAASPPAPAGGPARKPADESPAGSGRPSIADALEELTSQATPSGSADAADAIYPPAVDAALKECLRGSLEKAQALLNSTEQMPETLRQGAADDMARTLSGGRYLLAYMGFENALEACAKLPRLRGGEVASDEARSCRQQALERLSSLTEQLGKLQEAYCEHGRQLRSHVLPNEVVERLIADAFHSYVHTLESVQDNGVSESEMRAFWIQAVPFARRWLTDCPAGLSGSADVCCAVESCCYMMMQEARDQEMAGFKSDAIVLLREAKGWLDKLFGNDILKEKVSMQLHFLLGRMLFTHAMVFKPPAISRMQEGHTMCSRALAAAQKLGAGEEVQLFMSSLLQLDEQRRSVQQSLTSKELVGKCPCGSGKKLKKCHLPWLMS